MGFPEHGRSARRSWHARCGNRDRLRARHGGDDRLPLSLGRPSRSARRLASSTAGARDPAPSFVVGCRAWLDAVAARTPRAAYCAASGDTTPSRSAITPGAFLELHHGQPAKDARLSEATIARFVQGATDLDVRRSTNRVRAEGSRG